VPRYLRRASTSILLLLLLSMRIAAQAPAGQQEPPVPQTLTAVAGVAPGESDATLVFANRPIVVLRARVMGRQPAERVASAMRVLSDLSAEGIVGPVTARPVESNNLILVGSRTVLGLTTLDIDEAAGETLEGQTARATAAMQLALSEAVEARRPTQLLRAAVVSVLVLAAAMFLLILVARVHRRLSRKLIERAEQRVARSGTGQLEILRASRILDFWRRFFGLVYLTLTLLIAYFAISFSLRQFPYTRPWGESMREYMLSTVSRLALDIAGAMPALFTVFLIFLVARFCVRMLHLLFTAIEQDRVQVQWLHPETAQPTRRILTSLTWLFAAVMAYPYLPGSGTDAFKGASVFIGLVVSLGSSGLVNQMMSSFMITYSRSLRLGDYVRVGDIEGTVVSLGVLSTKVKTLRGEEVTIPNAVVVGTTTTNYSRFGETGVYTPTSVTIGYDTPWRQVESLLLLAAERTPNLRTSPPPVVRQSALKDFYIEYTLLVSLEQPQLRVAAMSALHANILDVFNEYGVQIMSPNYEADPEGQKTVPKERWYAAPATNKNQRLTTND